MPRSLLPVLAASILLASVSLLLYQPATHHPFVWDTRFYLVYNEFWLSSLGAKNLIWMFFSSSVWNWHPLTWLSWALDYQLYNGLNTRGFHLSNHILHAINTVLLFVLGLRLLRFAVPDEMNQAQTRRAAVLAFTMASLLFAVHPQHVETVAWVAARQHLLCQALLLLATLSYLRFADPNGQQPVRWLYIASILFMLAGLAKPTAIIWPIALLLLDIYPLRRWRPRPGAASEMELTVVGDLLREKRYLFILAALMVLPTLLTRTMVVHDFPVIDRVWNALTASLFYPVKMFWPEALSTYYPWFVQTGADKGLLTLLAPLFVVGATAGAMLAWRKNHPAWLIAWLFYLLALAPVSGLIPVGPHGGADRYAYLSTLPAYLLAGGGLFLLFQKSQRWLTISVCVATLAVATSLGGKARSQITAWQSELSLWQTAQRYYPDDAFVNHQLGAAHLEQGQLEQAAGYFEYASEKDRDLIQPLAWLGLVNLRLERFDDALGAQLRLGEHAASGKPPLVDEECLVYNIAWTLARSGEWTEAANQFRVLPAHGMYSDFSAMWLAWLEAKIAAPDAATAGGHSMADLPGPCYAPLSEMRRIPMTADHEGLPTGG